MKNPSKLVDKSDLNRLEEEEHKRYHRRIVYILILLTALLFGGATFYHKVEGWRYIDALYFSTATMTTVGYGDITPKTDTGKIFTIFFAFTGVAIALYGLSTLATHFVEVREEFWLERIAKIRINRKTTDLLSKVKSVFMYDSRKLAESYKKMK